MPENEGSKPPKKHKNLVFVLGKVDSRAWEQQQANAKSIGRRESSSRPTQRSIGKKKESYEPPKRSIGKSKCAQIFLFLKLVR